MNLSDIAVVSATPTKTTATTCPYCGVGCGVRATVRADGQVEVSGDADHASNFGRLCVKGSALGETVDLNGRLLHPQVRDADGQLHRVSWDDALDKVAAGFTDIIAKHGPDAVALYVSGQILTEDYYIANKLMKGFIGTANIDTNSRLCMSSAVAGHKRAFGEDLVPCSYEDLEQADLVVLVGSNTAWCHPILFQRLTRAKEARPEMKIVAIDPRRTATCELADLHLPLRAGTDVRLFNGLLSYLAREGAVDTAFVAAHTAGMEETLAVAEAGGADIAAIARDCKLDPQDVQAFYALFAATPRAVTAFSMGVNQSSSGTDKVNSIINCHLLTGRIGKPGMGPFSLTGQPNAMGGREVGGLANMLAAHMELANPVHRDIVQDFWQSPAMADKPGLKAVDLFEAIEQGKVKAVWVIATNPVVSLPDADQARRALARCELVVTSDIVTRTDTNDAAHILLPALGWGEKDGTVTNTERRISRQRAFLPAPGEARADWAILCDVARRMGFDGFDYAGQHEIFDEHARLSAWRNGDDTEGHAPRAFDISGLAGLGKDAYDGLEPVQWPVRPATPEGTQRLFLDGRYAHPDGRARFIATAPRAPANAADDDFPLILNTGRVRDQWHTMTRTGKAARLSDHLPEPFVDMHPQDALLCGVGEGKLARISSRWGAMVARVRFGGGIPRGSVFVPIHWNGQFSSDARVGALVNPAVDPVSGEPEFKHTPVRVEEFRVSWHGFVLSRNDLPADALTYWTRVQGKQFQRYEFAGREVIADRSAWARELLGVHDADADWLEYEDRTAGVYHAGYVVDDRLVACVFVSTRTDLPSRAWLSQLFSQGRLEDSDRIGLLLGQPMEKGADAGPTVCSCFGVGRNTICDAVREHDLKTPAEITACVKAGGNCGSCVPELKKLLVEIRVAEVA
ncbi:assimilatory nitrate reductase (NADH) alpha subunit apoprotein [Cupriavidus sp. YR651]|uniref:nitrate reductase n=1 Tax=Cupriavidus sp. YR651 TaxID=1855315 RepID=UPI0008811D27|nr:nitrate reductase [Cupriavidus sp. YR651]SDD49701.1 assimilatory nitrate reductase (NADH) alpha subunit apoprotein [Cupriavidus sp. YR651]